MDKKPPLLSSNNLAVLFYALAIFCLTRQYPFSRLSSLIFVFIVLAIGITLPKIWRNFNESKKEIKVFTIIYFIVFTTLLLYSIMIRNNGIVDAVRTYAVCLFLAITYFFIKDKRLAKAFIFMMFLHAIVVIGMQIYMMQHSSPSYNSHVRGVFLNSGFGDIYTRNGWLFRIIIKGNELLPVAFMMADTIYKKGIKRLYKYVILISIGIAGNLAYFIALSMYFLAKMVTNKNGRKLVLILIYIGMAFFIIFNKPIINQINKTMELKNRSSMPIRYEQIETLLEDFREPYEVILGRGMGNTITAQKNIRTYTNDKYFELQIFYFLNQLGVLPFVFFIFYNLYVSIKILNKETLIIYGSYVLYALTNPYIFNLTHIIIIIALASLKEVIKQSNNKEIMNEVRL